MIHFWPCKIEMPARYSTEVSNEAVKEMGLKFSLGRVWS